MSNELSEICYTSEFTSCSGFFTILKVVSPVSAFEAENAPDGDTTAVFYSDWFSESIFIK